MAVTRLLLGFVGVCLSLSLLVNGGRLLLILIAVSMSVYNNTGLYRPDCQWITDRWNKIGQL